MSRAARLGAFIIVTLAILAVGIFIVGSKQYLFTRTYQLKSQFATVVGLDEGAEVRIGGVHRGTVKKIQLPHTPAGEITVVMELDSSTHDIIKDDSVASIETEGLLGNEYLAVSFGSPSALNVRDGDTIASQPPLVIADLMKKTDGILDSSQAALKNVTQATASLSSISAKIDTGEGTVGALVNDRKVYDELDQAMTGVQQTITQAQAGVTDFQEDMEALKHNFFVSGYFKNRGYEDSAELQKDGITTLPQIAPVKIFAFDAKKLFDKQGNAKLKSPKSLGSAGEFLASNDFGLAVVVAYTGMEGDAARNLTLTQGRALVVREYLVENFGFDDSKLKTLGLGKKDGKSAGTGWGAIEVDVYPTGTEMPPSAKPRDPAAINKNGDQPVQGPPATTHQPE